VWEKGENKVGGIWRIGGGNGKNIEIKKKKMYKRRGGEEREKRKEGKKGGGGGGGGETETK